MKQLARIAAASALLISVAAPTALVFADNTTSTKSGNAVNLSCMTAAVDKRETVIESVANSYASTIQNALTSRKSALDTAWSITNSKDRRAAIRAAWRTFSSTIRKARYDYRTATKAAWQTFYADRKSCGRGATAEDPTSHEVDQGF